MSPLSTSSSSIVATSVGEEFVESGLGRTEVLEVAPEVRSGLDVEARVLAGGRREQVEPRRASQSSSSGNSAPRSAVGELDLEHPEPVERDRRRHDRACRCGSSPSSSVKRRLDEPDERRAERGLARPHPLERDAVAVEHRRRRAGGDAGGRAVDEERARADRHGALLEPDLVGADRLDAARVGRRRRCVGAAASSPSLRMAQWYASGHDRRVDAAQLARTPPAGGRRRRPTSHAPTALDLVGDALARIAAKNSAPGCTLPRRRTHESRDTIQVICSGRHAVAEQPDARVHAGLARADHHELVVAGRDARAASFGGTQATSGSTSYGGGVVDGICIRECVASTKRRASTRTCCAREERRDHRGRRRPRSSGGTWTRPLTAGIVAA